LQGVVPDRRPVDIKDHNRANGIDGNNHRIGPDAIFGLERDDPLPGCWARP
jgi:hypothetical protein